MAMDVMDLAGGIARDLLTALLGAAMFVAAVIFVTRRPTGGRARRRRRAAAARPVPALPVATSTVALARARAATRRAEDPHPPPLAASGASGGPAAVPAATDPSEAVSAMVVHLAETNPRFLAQVLSAWINDEVPDRGHDERTVP
jgi:hypothetical protein